MTQVVYYVAASLDGFIAGPQGELDWLHAFEQVGNDYGYGEFFATVDGLVMGRATWEVARSFGAWPYGDRPAWLLLERDWRAPALNGIARLIGKLQGNSRNGRGRFSRPHPVGRVSRRNHNLWQGQVRRIPCNVRLCGRIAKIALDFSGW